MAEVLFRDRILGLERIPANELLPHPENWRRHPPAQRTALRAMFARLGIADAALVRRLPDGRAMLLDGHLRSEELGAQPIPCLVTDLDEDEARQLLATLDPLAALASADEDVLIKLLANATPLPTEAFEALWPDGVRAEARGNPDACPPKPRKVRSRLGDVWVLGEHRLLCGDCRDGESIARLFGEEHAGLVNTDPPYGVDYGDVADSRERSRAKREHRKIENDDLDGAVLQEFLEASLRACLPVLGKAPAFYLWHPMLTQGTFFAAAAAANIHVHRQIIWVKPSLILGRADYHWRHELCFYGWIIGRRCVWLAGRDQTTVWEVGRENAGVHPTQKPVELFRRPILNHLRPGAICYDPFAGSGSQVIAAEENGRRCFAVEIDPGYCDVVVARWEQFSGKKAERKR